MEIAGDLPSYEVNMLLLGPSAVGKSVLLSRWASGEFLPHYVPTLGCLLDSTDCRMKVEQLGDMKARVIVWELGGNKEHLIFLTILLRSLDGLVCVFSVADKKSFEALCELLQDVSTMVTLSDLFSVIVGTHADTSNLREVDFQEAKSYATKMNMEYMESGSDVDNGVLTEAAKSSLQKRVKETEETKRSEEEKMQSHWCCIGKRK